MGLCSGKLGPGDGDVLATTSWVREVVTSHQKKRKGDPYVVIVKLRVVSQLMLAYHHPNTKQLFKTQMLLITQTKTLPFALLELLS